MVLILDGNSEHVARLHDVGKQVSSKRKKRFVTGLDLIKCLIPIKEQILRLSCATISDLPSNASTMGNIYDNTKIVLKWIGTCLPDIQMYIPSVQEVVTHFI